MENENRKIANRKNAKIMYDMICNTLREKNLKFIDFEDTRTVMLQIEAEFPMNLMAQVDEERQLIRLISLLPVEFPEDKRIDGAIAAGMTNFNMFVGSFDFDYERGRTAFRMTASFLNSVISPDVILSLVGRSVTMLDDYGTKLCKLAEGQMSIEQYLDMFDED